MIFFISILLALLLIFSFIFKRDTVTDNDVFTLEEPNFIYKTKTPLIIMLGTYKNPRCNKVVNLYGDCLRFMLSSYFSSVPARDH